MKLVNYRTGDAAYRLGVVNDNGIVDVAELAQALQIQDVPVTIDEAIRRGREAVDALQALIDQAVNDGHPITYLAEADIKYGACVPKPGKIICVGLNYRKHAEETNSPIPAYPVLFNKFDNAIAGHQDEIGIPEEVQEADYEAELVIVIGRQTKNVSEADALAHVFGYCNANDVSARDLQNRTSQWMLGKSCDQFAPIGPYLVTADEVGDPNKLAITCKVNGELRQSSNTADMIFSCKQIIAYLSKVMTLNPGDIILTGTPEGVIVGYPPEKRVWLDDGDTVVVEIEKLGVLENRFVRHTTQSVGGTRDAG